MEARGRPPFPRWSSGFGGALALLLCLLLLSESARYVVIVEATYASKPLRILTLNWLSNNGLAWHAPGPLRSLQAFFPLAIEDFNARDGSVLPVFSQLGNCSAKLELSVFADDEGTGATGLKAFIDAQAADPPVELVLGPFRTNVALPVSIAAGALHIPVVSHFAMASFLDDDDMFPTFTRTSPSDTTQSHVASMVLRALGLFNVGLLHSDEGHGISYARDLAEACENVGVSLTSVSYPDKAQGAELVERISKALTALNSQRIKVIVLLPIVRYHFVIIARELAAQGLLSASSVFITFDPKPELLLTEYTADAVALSDMLRGSLNLVYAVPGLEIPPRDALDPFGKLVARYAALATRLNVINRYFPNVTLGGQPMKLTPADIQASSAKGVYTGWAWAYDAVAAVGLALCENPEARGAELTNLIRRQDFMGVSGQVRFTPSGNRDPATTALVLHNINGQPPAGSMKGIPSSLRGIPVAYWMPGDLNWTTNLSASILFRDGTNNVPVDHGDLDDEPFLDPKFTVPTWLMTLSHILGTFVIVTAASMMLWLYVNREKKLVQEFQPHLMGIALAGVLLMGVSIFVLTFERTSGECMAFEWIANLGVILVSLACMSKSVRVIYIWRHLGLNLEEQDKWSPSVVRGIRRRFTAPFDRRVLLPLLLGVPFLLLLVVWTTMSPLVVATLGITLADNTTSYFRTCDFQAVPAAYFLGGEYAYLLIVLFWTLVCARLSASAPKRFQDSWYISMLAFWLFQLVMLAMILLQLAFNTPTTAVAIRLAYATSCSIVTMLLVFLPRFVRVRKEILFANLGGQRVLRPRSTSLGSSMPSSSGQLVSPFSSSASIQNNPNRRNPNGTVNQVKVSFLVDDDDFLEFSPRARRARRVPRLSTPVPGNHRSFAFSPSSVTQRTDFFHGGSSVSQHEDDEERKQDEDDGEPRQDEQPGGAEAFPESAPTAKPDAVALL